MESQRLPWVLHACEVLDTHNERFPLFIFYFLFLFFVNERHTRSVRNINPQEVVSRNYRGYFLPSKPQCNIQPIGQKTRPGSCVLGSTLYMDLVRVAQAHRVSALFFS